MSKSQRIPVKVISVTDIKGNKIISVMMDMGYFLDPQETYQKKLDEFKEKYIKLIEDARVLRASFKGRAPRAIVYWKLGELMYNFTKRTEHDFLFTNYRASFQRDLGITDSYVGVIMDFPLFFREEEVSSSIPMSDYFEVLLKARRFQKKGELTEVKKWMKDLELSGQFPEHKAFREMLSNKLSHP